MKKLCVPPEYERDCEALRSAFQEWILLQSESRLVDLRWYDWGRVAIAGPLCGDALGLLCASDDARAMCEWSDARTMHRCTLLQALTVAEVMGLKKKGDGEPHPPALRRIIAGSLGLS